MRVYANIVKDGEGEKRRGDCFGGFAGEKREGEKKRGNAAEKTGDPNQAKKRGRGNLACD